MKAKNASRNSSKRMGRSGFVRSRRIQESTLRSTMMDRTVPSSSIGNIKYTKYTWHLNTDRNGFDENYLNSRIEVDCPTSRNLWP